MKIAFVSVFCLMAFILPFPVKVSYFERTLDLVVEKWNVGKITEKVTV